MNVFIILSFPAITKNVDTFIKTELGKPEKWLLEAASVIGLDFSELTHETKKQIFQMGLFLTDKKMSKQPEAIPAVRRKPKKGTSPGGSQSHPFDGHFNYRIKKALSSENFDKHQSSDTTYNW
ncbi:MAG: hypothetical protein LBV20_05730 [Treponema sp.]|jgi:hypothetical protein|nr:hypothetical protein [Treponema sp.]